MTVGFTWFSGVDLDKNCVDNVFQLKPGASKSFSGIAFSPCMCWAESANAAWGGGLEWLFSDLPAERRKHPVLVSPFAPDSLPSLKSNPSERVLSLRSANAWLTTRESVRAVSNYLKQQFIFKLQARWIPVGKESSQTVAVINAMPLESTVYYSVAIGEDFASSRRRQYLEKIKPGARRLLPGLPAGARLFSGGISLSAWAGEGEYYWSFEGGATGDKCNGIVVPPDGLVPVVEGYQTVVTLNQDYYSGEGRFQAEVSNATAKSIIVEIRYQPYPGDEGVRTLTIPSMKRYLCAISPSNKFTVSARTEDGRRKWETQTFSFSESATFRNTATINFAD
jgi:hypothetical protein